MVPYNYKVSNTSLELLQNNIMKGKVTKYENNNQHQRNTERAERVQRHDEST